MSDWIKAEDLPDAKSGAEYLMVLDGVEQKCVEVTEPNDCKRWFYGEQNGVYPVDEIELFKPIPTV